jgi:hypothetical protein
MKLVYIAGPFRAATAWEVENNVRNAETMGYEVAKLGAMPMIPHANTRFFHGQFDDQFWIVGTLLLLERCDAMLVLPGWENSQGTKGEMRLCEDRGMPYFFKLGDLEKWLSQFQ